MVHLEAKKLGIPIIAIIDTNCDPDPIDYPIPANDDSIRTIQLIMSMIADTILDSTAKKSEKLEKGKRLLEERFSGKIDINTFYMKRSAYTENISSRLEGDIDGIIFLHD